MSPKTTYYANGKLLITGEYLVLDGAKALAIPTKRGQNLIVSPIDEPKIYWKSFNEHHQMWFEHVFSLPIVSKKSDPIIVQRLKKILHVAQMLQADFLTDAHGFVVETHMDFPSNWGLGSSSTLIYNVAKWAQVNPYELLKNSLGGSGYDIACAGHNTPITYQLFNKKPEIHEVNFRPVFHEQIFFVHLNQKQKSASEIHKYQDLVFPKEATIPVISEITELMLRVNNLKDFEILMLEHEKLMSKVLGRDRVHKMFHTYFGQTKSLGAWGGDFIMATGNEDTKKYFENKGFPTVLTFSEMIR